MFRIKEEISYLYWGMLAQNHRGHQSHGFATLNKKIDHFTQIGLIPPNSGEFENFSYHKLDGKVGIGNVRYVTSGSLDLEAKQRDAMPIVLVGNKHSIAISFNGNIVNVREYRQCGRHRAKHVRNKHFDDDGGHGGALG